MSRRRADKTGDEKVRVWWPPTKDKERTGFSGAYWPASVLKKGSNYLEVEYDNGERERVDPDNIFPDDVPIAFGKEATPLEAGEFVEVFNNSKTDPCAWLGVIATVGKKYRINYPFHDSPSEDIKPELLRRARVWDDLDWKFIEVGQTWRAGEVTSPIELTLLTEQEYFKQLPQVAGSKSKRAAAAAAAAAAPGSSGEEGEDEVGTSEQEETSGVDEAADKKQAGRKRGRPRKSSHPARAAIDEGSTGSDAKKDKEPAVGAKKRKPSRVQQA